mmetsp:Transcript_9842/g.18903  ORF Transcript_9842/g.18903 Transcript_9842/m.18903 type:complete len:174 (-) Transcript_9842:207-728(-)
MALRRVFNGVFRQRAFGWGPHQRSMGTVASSPQRSPDSSTEKCIIRSSKKLRSCRMVRKMIKEIFGHPNVPAEGEVVISLPPEKHVIVALVPEDKGLDVERLRLSYPTRAVTQEECQDMMMYTAARVRIDSELIPYYPHAFDHLLVDHSLRYWDSGHVLFGEFAEADAKDLES